MGLSARTQVAPEWADKLRGIVYDNACGLLRHANAKLESLDIDKSFIDELIMEGMRSRGERPVIELAGRSDSVLAYANSPQCSLEIKHEHFQQQAVPQFASCRWC